MYSFRSFESAVSNTQSINTEILSKRLVGAWHRGSRAGKAAGPPLMTSGSLSPRPGDSVGSSAAAQGVWMVSTGCACSESPLMLAVAPGAALGQWREGRRGAESASPEMLPPVQKHSTLSLSHSCLFSPPCLPDSRATFNIGQESMWPVPEKQTNSPNVTLRVTTG